MEVSLSKGRYARESAASRGYGHRWRKARETFLQRNPLCRMCEQMGRITPATVVDHITPHKGNQKLFWDSTNNWQPLCKPCHDGAKAKEEARGQVIGCDESGRPLDPNHPWYQG